MLEKTSFVLSPSYHEALSLLRQMVPVGRGAPRCRQATVPEDAGA